MHRARAWTEDLYPTPSVWRSRLALDVRPQAKDLVVPVQNRYRSRHSCQASQTGTRWRGRMLLSHGTCGALWGHPWWFWWRPVGVMIIMFLEEVVDGQCVLRANGNRVRGVIFSQMCLILRRWCREADPRWHSIELSVLG